MTIGIGLTMGLALLIYPFFVLCDLFLATDKLGAGFAFVMMLVIWLMLSIALLLVRIRGEIPLWSGLVALLLMPISPMFLGISMFDMPDLWAAHYPVRWMAVVHALVPLLMFAYVGWASIPGIRRMLSANHSSLIVWGAVFALTMLTTITWPKTSQLAEQRQKEINLARRAEFDKIPLDAPVRDWMPYLDADSPELRNGAFQRIRAVKNKQSEIEQILQSGRYSYRFFTYVSQFELSPTPSLCESMRKWLREQSIGLKPTSSMQKYSPIAPGGPNDNTPLAACLPTIRWFAINKCPMLDEVNAFKATLRMYRRGNENEPFFSALDEIGSMLEKQ